MYNIADKITVGNSKFEIVKSLKLADFVSATIGFKCEPRC